MGLEGPMSVPGAFGPMSTVESVFSGKTDSIFSGFGKASGMIDPTWISAGSQVLGAALGGGKAGGSAKSDASQYVEQTFDHSGWNVTTGTGNIESSREQTPALSGVLPWVAIAFAGILLWKMSKA